MNEWTEERIALLKKLWTDDELTASQCAKVLEVTRNTVIGKVYRLDLHKRTVGASRKSGGNGSVGKYRGVVRAARKTRTAKHVPSKPTPIRRPPDEVFKPVEVELYGDAWAALPGTTPVSMEALARDACRWPIGDDTPFLFCGCEAAPGSSYCPTHKRRASGKGTNEERRAPRALVAFSRLEVKNGFRGRQAGQSL